MASLIDKIGQLIKREKTTPERKRKKECAKSSNEILSELFGAFNADPPKIEEVVPAKKAKKSKKKHKKEKKKRSRSSNSSSDSDSDYSHKRKKRKKSKSRKRKDRDRTVSPPPLPSLTPVLVKPDINPLKYEPTKVKMENIKVKEENVKVEPKTEKERRVSVKLENSKTSDSSDHYKTVDFKKSPEHKSPDYYKIPTTPENRTLTENECYNIPRPDSPHDIKLDSTDLRFKLDSKKVESDTDKAKGKIQIKNLKFSAVYEETVKKAEEEAKKKAKLYEEGEYTDSSSNSDKEDAGNSQFPKTSDPGGILKMAEESRVCDEEKSSLKRSKEVKSHKSTKRDRSRTPKRPSSKSRRDRKSRSRSASRRHHRSSSKSRRRSRSRHVSPRRRSTDRIRPRHRSPRHHSPRRDRGRGRSPSGVKLADSEKKRLLEVARRNAINMLKNGAVPAGAAALPPHTRNQVMAAIQSGGKSVDELTDFCKHLSKKEALGELSSVTSDDGMSENEDTIAFHHPFLVKEKAPIVMNIRGGAPLPVKSSVMVVANKEELRLQFPVSSGSQHREKSTEWVPVSPKKDNMQVAKLGSSNHKSSSSKPTSNSTESKSSHPPLPAPPVAPLPLPAPPVPPLSLFYSPQSTTKPTEDTTHMKSLTAPTQLTTVLPALPAPGPQAYPPGIVPPKIDLAAIVSQKIAMIRQEQEKSETTSTHGFGWSREKLLGARDRSLGQFTGSTGAQILTPRELASGMQAWAKKLLSDLGTRALR